MWPCTLTELTILTYYALFGFTTLSIDTSKPISRVFHRRYKRYSRKSTLAYGNTSYSLFIWQLKHFLSMLWKLKGQNHSSSNETMPLLGGIERYVQALTFTAAINKFKRDMLHYSASRIYLIRVTALVFLVPVRCSDCGLVKIC